MDNILKVRLDTLFKFLHITNRCINKEINFHCPKICFSLFARENIAFSLTISTPKRTLYEYLNPYPRDIFISFSRFVYSKIAGTAEPYHCLGLNLFYYEGRPTHTIKGKYLYNISITLAGVCALG